MILTLEEWITKYCLVINSLESTNRGMLSLESTNRGMLSLESTNRGMLSLESTNRGMLVRRLYVTATVSQWYDDLQATTRYYLIIYHSDTTTYRLPLGIIWLFITVIRRLTGYHSVLSDYLSQWYDDLQATTRYYLISLMCIELVVEVLCLRWLLGNILWTCVLFVVHQWLVESSAYVPNRPRQPVSHTTEAGSTHPPKLSVTSQDHLCQCRVWLSGCCETWSAG